MGEICLEHFVNLLLRILMLLGYKKSDIFKLLNLI